MDNTNQLLIALVKSALTGKPVPLPAQPDLPALLERSAAHQVEPMAFAGLSNCGAVTAEAKKLFLEPCTRELIRHQQQQAAVKKLLKAFRENEIDYLSVKGTLLKALYPAPELRVMSDVDILIRLTQYPRIREIMLEQGFREGQETDHELVWLKLPYITVELHKHLIPSYNTDYYAHYTDDWAMAVPTETEHAYELRREEHLAFLVTHFAKHYRDGGIGIRHLTDIWLFVNRQQGLDLSYVERRLEELRLLTFYRNILRTAAVWFEDAADDPVTAFMTARILESGSGGTKEKNDAAKAARVSRLADTPQRARQKKLVRSIFPPMEKMKKQYPLLETRPVLLPAMWAARWGRLLRDPKNVADQLRQLQLVNDAVVGEYDAELELVGLSFDL